MGVSGAAAIVGALAAAAGTSYSIKSNMDAKSQAEDAAQQQKEQQDQAVGDAKAQQSQAASDAAAATSTDQALLDRNKSRSDLAAAQASLGRQGTILTSPLGIPNTTPATGGKSVLGS